MSVSANQITIAVTVYSRRQFIKQAVASALNQSVPVRVVVVEDCGPDPTLESFVKNEFGSKIEYIRNPRRRGLFGNWNVCLALCRTEWITILHDDDYLAPNYTQAMVELAAEAPGETLYFGRTIVVKEGGEVAAAEQQDARIVAGRWVKRDLRDILFEPFLFPGHLFEVATAKRLGGFRESSYMAGDWEMWAKLMASGGAAQTSQIVAFSRSHGGWDRGSNQAARTGKHMPSVYVHHKRILSLLPPEQRVRMDRVALQRRSPLGVRYLLHCGDSMSRRMLRYHVGLMRLSKPPHWRYAIYQQCARVGGAGFVRLTSRLWNRLHRT
jgi:glycosyltransferase involved in cell wall biosynthesis